MESGQAAAWRPTGDPRQDVQAHLDPVWAEHEQVCKAQLKHRRVGVGGQRCTPLKALREELSAEEARCGQLKQRLAEIAAQLRQS